MSYTLSKKIKPNLVDTNVIKYYLKQSKPEMPKVNQIEPLSEYSKLLSKLFKKVSNFIIDNIGLIVVLMILNYLLWKRYKWYTRKNKKKRKNYEINDNILEYDDPINIDFIKKDNSEIYKENKFKYDTLNVKSINNKSMDYENSNNEIKPNSNLNPLLNDHGRYPQYQPKRGDALVPQQPLNLFQSNDNILANDTQSDNLVSIDTKEIDNQPQVEIYNDQNNEQIQQLQQQLQMVSNQVAKQQMLFQQKLIEIQQQKQIEIQQAQQAAINQLLQHQQSQKANEKYITDKPVYTHREQMKRHQSQKGPIKNKIDSNHKLDPADLQNMLKVLPNIKNNTQIYQPQHMPQQHMPQHMPQHIQHMPQQMPQHIPQQMQQQQMQQQQMQQQQMLQQQMQQQMLQQQMQQQQMQQQQIQQQQMQQQQKQHMQQPQIAQVQIPQNYKPQIYQQNNKQQPQIYKPQVQQQNIQQQVQQNIEMQPKSSIQEKLDNNLKIMMEKRQNKEEKITKEETEEEIKPYLDNFLGDSEVYVSGTSSYALL